MGGDDEKTMLRSNCFWPVKCHLYPSPPNTFADLSPKNV